MATTAACKGEVHGNVNERSIQANTSKKWYTSNIGYSLTAGSTLVSTLAKLIVG